MTQPIANVAMKDAVTNRRGVLFVLRDRWWLVVIPMIVATALAGLLAASQTKIYEAQANVLFQQTAFDQLLFGQTVFAQAPSTPTAPIDTDMRLLGERTIADRVIAELHLHSTPTALRKHISISQQADSNVVTLAAQDPNPQQAQRIANAWVDSYLAIQKTANQQPLIAAASSLRSQLASQTPGTTSSGSAHQLQSRLNEIELLTQLQTPGASVALRATTPRSPISPAPRRDAAIGGIVGLAFGGLLAIGAGLLDRRIKTVEEAEAAYEVPVLATVSRHREPDSREDASWRAHEEGFRMLRSMVGFANLGRSRPSRTILIASAEVGDGKSSVCAGLGFAAASAGQRVLCIDADLRRPTLPARLGCATPDRGLIDALLEGASLESVLTDVAIRSSVSGGTLPSGQSAGSLRLLSVGLVPPNPAELIASDPFGAALTELTHDPDIDLVVIDSPPLTAVSDAAVLARLCDGVLVVVRANHSSQHVANEAMTILRRAGTPVLGLVVVGVRKPGRDYYYAADIGRSNGKSVATGDVELPDSDATLQHS